MAGFAAFAAFAGFAALAAFAAFAAFDRRLVERANFATSCALATAPPRLASGSDGALVVGATACTHTAPRTGQLPPSR